MDESNYTIPSDNRELQRLFIKNYSAKFAEMNKQLEDIIRQARQTGGTQQEIRILQAIKKGFKVQGMNGSPSPSAMTSEFFKLNDRKLDALIEATMHDMKKRRQRFSIWRTINTGK